MSVPGEFVAKSLAIAQMELKKLFRDPTELFSRAVQPVLWLAVFGQVFSRVRGIPIGSVGYLAFMTPGILAQSVLFAAIFYGIAVIWERDLGVIHKLLVSPCPRSALVFGKAVSAGVRGLVQAAIIYLLALVMHIPLRTDPLAVLGVLSAVVLGSALFATFSLIIACIVKTRERFMGIGQVLTMPLFFASNAIYPLALMPPWLRVVAGFNPLTYLVDALRALMIAGAPASHSLVANFLVLTVVFVLFVIVAARLYPTLVE
ncbi:ABC transporter permease [Crenobacter sp. SG2303]|uniref:Transport permease protein n=1 Tax=Crenobacter oryzisoli TaxID=3056844 RepID=A0ABT7XQQ0_9NEIS|nr:ABC transporter permease [Crenobacter sp. SG2303]MDN0076028.1 ABC transporter permease [Crenobacter sp. SG2303]